MKMAIYLLKDCRNQSAKDRVEWSEEELEKTVKVLLDNGFEKKDKGIYAQEKDIICIKPRQIQIPSTLEKSSVLLRIIAEIAPAFYLNNKAELHYIDELFK